MQQAGLVRAALTAATLFISAGLAAQDVAIVANVRAKELRFTQTPEVRVTLRCEVNGAACATVSKTDRRNLPEKVQPNVTYRDIGIRLTITSTLPNIEQILDEVLGPQSRIREGESDEECRSCTLRADGHPARSPGTDDDID